MTRNQDHLPRNHSDGHLKGCSASHSFWNTLFVWLITPYIDSFFSSPLKRNLFFCWLCCCFPCFSPTARVRQEWKRSMRNVWKLFCRQRPKKNVKKFLCCFGRRDSSFAGIYLAGMQMDQCTWQRETLNVAKRNAISNVPGTQWSSQPRHAQKGMAISTHTINILSSGCNERPRTWIKNTHSTHTECIYTVLPLLYICIGLLVLRGFDLIFDSSTIVCIISTDSYYFPFFFVLSIDYITVAVYRSFGSVQLPPFGISGCGIYTTLRPIV